MSSASNLFRRVTPTAAVSLQARILVQESASPSTEAIEPSFQHHSSSESRMAYKPDIDQYRGAISTVIVTAYVTTTTTTTQTMALNCIPPRSLNFGFCATVG